jgi:LysM repeat protein
MTLPSQVARSGSSARTFTRTRRRRKGVSGSQVLLFGFIAIVVGICVWVLVSQGSSVGESSNTPETLTNPAADESGARGPAGDALSRPVSQSGQRLASNDRGTRSVTPPPVTQPVTQPVTPTVTQPQRAVTTTPAVTPVETTTSQPASGTSQIDARRERQSTSSPSPLAAALSGENATSADRQPATRREAAPAPRPAETARPSGGDEAATQAMRTAEAEIARGRPAAARQILDTVYRTALSPTAKAEVRQSLSALNTQLIFSPTLYQDEPLTKAYVIEPGDALSRIATKEKLAVDWRLIQRVNQISDPGRIRVGQTLKLVRGPFHAVVSKSAYRLDLYQGEASDRSGWRYIASMSVGLGEGDSTPTGNFTVRPDSKLIDPLWVNPRTGEKFDASDPKNPIGERWIGLDGLGADAIKTGYGIHGTIDPGSIGQQRSMGCVRLGDKDVELVYELLMPGSLVYIVE